GVSLVGAFLDGLRSSFNQILGFLEAQAGDGADFLDDLDLLGAGVSENDVELGLLFNRGSSSGARSSGNGDRSSSGNAPLLFQQLRQLSRFENGQGRQVFNDLGEISHFVFPS